jgi:hypothetical protein
MIKSSARHWGLWAKQNAYIVDVTVQGMTDVLFNRHALHPNGQEGSPERLEDSVWRDGRGFICMPGDWMYQAVLQASRHIPNVAEGKETKLQFQMGLVNLRLLVRVIGPKNYKRNWDFLDRQACTAGLRASGHVEMTRMCPAFREGWAATFRLAIVVSSLIPSQRLFHAVADAGEFIGIGALCPTKGRFKIIDFRTRQLMDLNTPERALLAKHIKEIILVRKAS